MGRIGLFDLERHFAFYGAYHRNPVNILIHTLFVWPIFFTSLVLFHFTPSLYSFPNGFCLNLWFAFTAMYAGFYVCLDKKAGSVAALLCVLCWVQSTLLASRLGFSQSWKVVLAAQLFCWTGQFIGHGVFEKRAPALWDGVGLSALQVLVPSHALLIVWSRLNHEGMEGHRNLKGRQSSSLWDNLVQAFLMGPFFVLLECLQLVFGYEPYQGFHASVEEKIEAQIKEWQDKKQKKIT